MLFQMMQLVPALSPVNNQTLNHIDFDLDLLDCQVEVIKVLTTEHMRHEICL